MSNVRKNEEISTRCQFSRGLCPDSIGILLCTSSLGARAVCPRCSPPLVLLLLLLLLCPSALASRTARGHLCWEVGHPGHRAVRDGPFRYKTRLVAGGGAVRLLLLFLLGRGRKFAVPAYKQQARELGPGPAWRPVHASAVALQAGKTRLAVVVVLLLLLLLLWLLKVIDHLCAS